MFSFIKQVLLYFYILYSKDKRRRSLIDQLKRKGRPQRDPAFDKPGLPDTIDDIYGVPDGWTEGHSFSAFNRDGTCFRSVTTDRGNVYRRVSVHLPTIGTLVYSETDDVGPIENSTTTQKKRLKTEVLDPMMKWKISFRGHMELVNNAQEQTTRFVRFCLYWNLTGDPHDFWLDTPAWTLAGECSKLPMSDALALSTLNSVWFEQWGELRGSVQVDDNVFHVRLPACRERNYAEVGTFDTRIDSVLSQHIEIDGIAHRYTYKTLKCKDGPEVNLGHVIFPSLESYHATKICSPKYESQDSFRSRFCNKEAEIIKTMGKHIVNMDRSEVWYNKYTMDGKPATGVTITTDSDITNKQISSTRREDDLPDTENEEEISGMLFVDIKDSKCMSKALVGGKAANLSYLHSFGYDVPGGFCVTTNTFHTVIEENPGLKTSLQNIEVIIGSLRFEDLKDACDEVVHRIVGCAVKSDIKTHIEAKVQDMHSFQTHGVAVRSSAKGEDGEVLSAAGQMETLLGVKGVDNIMDAIKQCWASYFSYQSVEYRRQNGQVIVDGMGVIVQEMVPSDVSGVMMTNDPMSGREDMIVINACCGLGEGVVSGKLEADSFVIAAENNTEFRVVHEHIVPKSKRVVVLPAGGTRIDKTATINETCLTESDMFRLCSLGKSIERSFRLEQEIEWAIVNGNFYILQTRPITSFDEETEDDLFQEFDTAVCGDRNLTTTCNLQEMMPGAATPLTLSYFVRSVSEAFAYMFTHTIAGAKRVYHPTGLVNTYANSVLMGMGPSYVVGANDIGGLKSKTFFNIDYLGGDVKEVTDEDIINYKGTPFNSNFKFIKLSLKRMLVTDPRYRRAFLKWENRVRTYTFAQHSSDVYALYKQVDANRVHLYEVVRVYFSTLMNVPIIIIKNTLMGNSSNLSRENKEDLSNLILKVGTVSAEVPKAIGKLARLIQERGLSEDFIRMEDNECLKLLTEDTDLKRRVDDFMQTQGHRGIREAELMEKNWSQEPLKLVHFMKVILQNGQVERDDDGKDESKIPDIVKNLKTKLTPFKRWLIEKVFLKKALDKVLDRERGKNMTIRLISAFKEAYWCLAKLMVREGRIPEEDLLFFLTHREIGELLDTRSPKLIRLAKRRRRVFPRQQSTRLEKLSFGIPKVLAEPDEASVTLLEPSVIIEGLPVGHGEATGRACIVTKEEDVNHIKKGDILVCRYTDVGWSPYYPIIGGLVTEVGSSLSHGVVVARECGIPCVVNVLNATKILKSGDTVSIHGNKGTVERLSSD